MILRLPQPMRSLYYYLYTIQNVDWMIIGDYDEIRTV